MKSVLRRSMVLVLMVVFAVSLCPPRAVAQEVSSESVLADIFVIRPLSIAGVAIGACAYVVCLPFTAWDKENRERVGEVLITLPGRYAFARPMGEFEE
jgi:hypothetical protein